MLLGETQQVILSHNFEPISPFPECSPERSPDGDPHVLLHTFKLH